MSDQRAWLEQWCPECHAAPGARCCRWRFGRGARDAAAHLHVARGWLKRRCPTCKAPPGERCSTPTGREASRVHLARLRPGRGELVWRPDVWKELERRGADMAIVPFSGRPGAGGQTDTITLLRLSGDALVEVERWSFRDELCYALEAPVWDRFGTFVGHPHIRGRSCGRRRSSVDDRGTRGERTFEELADEQPTHVAAHRERRAVRAAHQPQK